MTFARANTVGALEPRRRRLLAALTLFALTGSANGLAESLLYRLPLDWRDDDGSSLRLSRFAGKPVVITMAYGACRKICSTTLRRMEQLQGVADGDARDVIFVVASLDPQVDTPDAWRDYRKWRGLTRPNWHFLGGSESHTRTLAGHLGISYWRLDDHVVHDFSIALLDGVGNVRRKMRWADDDTRAFLR